MRYRVAAGLALTLLAAIRELGVEDCADQTPSEPWLQMRAASLAG